MSVDPRITWARQQLDDRLGEEITLESLARGVNLSTSHFTRLFRHHTGMAPAQYRRTARLEKARMLLETTFLSVKQVMAAAGFNDPSHFSRNFRRAYGASPRSWRARAGGPPPSTTSAVAQFSS